LGAAFERFLAQSGPQTGRLLPWRVVGVRTRRLCRPPSVARNRALGKMSQEAAPSEITGEFASSWIDSILEDIVAEPRGLPRAASSKSSTLDLSALLGVPYGDYAVPGLTDDVSSSLVSDRVVTMASGVPVRVLQVSVARQANRTGICGYKALYNAIVANHFIHFLAHGASGAPGSPVGITLSRSASADDTPSTPSAAASASAETTRLDDASSWHGCLSEHLHSRASFWRLFKCLKAPLLLDAFRRRGLRHTRAPRKPMWSDSVVFGGVLEREHLRFFLDQCSHLLEDLPSHLTVCQGEVNIASPLLDWCHLLNSQSTAWMV
jgi:hypothetical protein